MPDRTPRYRVSWYAPKVKLRLRVGGKPIPRDEAEAIAASLRRQGLRDVRVDPVGRLA